MRLISISGLLFFFINGQPSLKNRRSLVEKSKRFVSHPLEKKEKKKNLSFRVKGSTTPAPSTIVPSLIGQRESSRESNKEEESAKEGGGQVIRFRSNEKRELD